ncbi:sugar transferase [Gemmatirosa kalamazoonensis]|uniref:Sugar transferase n=1 Tax=Gemmatirosa kalamazoonensis TaxID=861299 RepID=W0RJH8_9BACT|nr:sugar transferase [Gemmatirosa kalamazoonensis]
MGAAALLVAGVPLIALCALLVRLRSPGPALFRQRREGLGGRPFTLYKLRTMRVDADAVLARVLADDAAARDEWARYRRLRDDPRLVPGVGSWLRRTSLDELPQLWNVLRGDMSLVGPRPLELPVLDRFPAAERAARAAVRPGLTGLWQVSGRSETDLVTLWAIDAEYVRSRSLLGDLRILVRTPRAVLTRRGAY